jgi:hypothetical protein
MHYKHLMCCGVIELNWICSRTPEDIITRLNKVDDGHLYPLQYLHGQHHATKPQFPYAFLVFSQAGAGGTYGEDLAKFIRKNKLGGISTTINAYKNPNSGNKLRVWLWAVDKKALLAWWKANGVVGTRP